MTHPTGFEPLDTFPSLLGGYTMPTDTAAQNAAPQMETTTNDFNKDAEQDRSLKWLYAWYTVIAATLWTIFLMAIIIAAGCSNIKHPDSYGCFLSDKVLIALLSTTSVFGLVSIILRYLFRDRKGTSR